MQKYFVFLFLLVGSTCWAQTYNTSQGVPQTVRGNAILVPDTTSGTWAVWDGAGSGGSGSDSTIVNVDVDSVGVTSIALDTVISDSLDVGTSEVVLNSHENCYITIVNQTPSSVVSVGSSGAVYIKLNYLDSYLVPHKISNSNIFSVKSDTPNTYVVVTGLK